MKKYIIALVVILLVVGGVAVAKYGNFGKSNDIVATSTSPVACLEEAARCPDGSLVTRSGPNCDFAKCPTMVTVPITKPVACTMEAKQCPDGSYVGRTGPKCEFTACPNNPNKITSIYGMLEFRNSEWYLVVTGDPGLLFKLIFKNGEGLTSGVFKNGDNVTVTGILKNGEILISNVEKK